MTARLLIVAVAVAILGGPAKAGPHMLVDRGVRLQADRVAAVKSAEISGRIFAADTGRPLRRAQVTLTGPERRTANTGVDGRYEFRGLAAGRYTISVTRSGYLTLQYGQRRPLELARPLEIGEAQTVPNADISLPRQGLIAGRVLDEFGDPVAGVFVQALRPAYVEGRRQLVVVTSTGFEGTDDTGEFRLTGLNPGSYYVRAMPRETWTVVSNGRRELMGFAATLFPSAIDVGQAALVEVGVGQQVGGTHISLVPGRPATLSGTAVDSQGRPLVGRSVSIGTRFLRETPGGGGSNVGAAPVAADGSFIYRNLLPGEYEVSVSTGEFGAGGELTRLQVVVTGGNVDNVRLVTSAGWSASGRIVTDQGTPPAFPRTAVTTVAASTLMQNAVRGAGTGEVRDDWTFSVNGILGPARLRATLPPGWMVKAMRHEGRDITSSFIEMPSGRVMSDIELVITDRVTRVTGQLTDERGAPLANGTVLVFADDRDKWGDGTTHVATMRPDQQGRYEFRGLPPGDYLAVALDYIQDRAWNDPDYLESLRRVAERFTLADAGSQALSLKIVNP